jgi:DNA-binding NarL/FixJ family response regulator
MIPYRIILADDHPLFRKGVRRIIEEKRGYEIVGEAADGLELLDMLKRNRAEMIILDIAMPKLRGLEAAREIKMIHPDVKILLLTMHRDTAYFRHAMAAGAEGYLLKEDADTELFLAIHAVRKGKTYVSPLLLKDLAGDLIQFCRGKHYENEDPLTTREREVLKLAAEGKSSREIGTLLHISHRTVENHRANIMKKLQTNRTADLVRYAVHKGYVDA